MPSILERPLNHLFHPSLFLEDFYYKLELRATDGVEVNLEV